MRVCVAFGVARGWWRDVAPATTGPGDGSQAYDAGDFSAASVAGSIGSYRRNFMVPSSAFARLVRAGDRHWIIRFESVKRLTRAPRRASTLTAIATATVVTGCNATR
jgi:hypothetical protein